MQQNVQETGIPACEIINLQEAPPDYSYFGQNKKNTPHFCRMLES
jgi:hypothetical protein